LLLAASCRPADEPARVVEAPKGIVTKTGAEMVLIPAGRFRMGSVAGKPDEAPVHEVAIEAFLMDRTEVTQEQYAKLVVGNPSHFKAPDRPVEQVSWADAALYCNFRSRDEGLEPCYDEKTTKCNFRASGYRLPTEAEWEYACRAGSDEAFGFGADERQLKQFAWYAENSSKKTQSVAQKKPNAWGLFDMHGNVAEWCNDVYEPGYYGASPAENPTGPADGEKYVLRGGAWNSTAGACRAAARVGEDPGFQDACFARDAIGFRCVRRAPAATVSGSNEGPKGSVGNALRGVPPDRRTTGTPRRAFPTGDSPTPDSQAARATQDPSPKSATAKTGLVYSDSYLRHDTGQGHPERPQRLTAIVERLEAQGLLSRLERLKPVATAEPWITAVHVPGYVERIRAACREGIATVDSRDTPVSRESYDVAVAAVGGVLAAVDAVSDEKVRNAFCAVRPPGHHAMKDRAMGFCLLNNVAIAARYAMKKHNLKKVLIVDWDVHHGNGTQAAFNDDPSVLYFSVHQHPFYPGTGTADEKGEGKAIGTKINVPLPAGSGDAEYRDAFEKILRPAALAFQPEFVLVSAGFDAYEHDLLGRMKVTPQGFAELTRIVKAIAEGCCRGRLVSVLEGGYDLDGLAACVEAHLRILVE
jgi:acetoin utilization deacetylase AcuC-like enzyme/formylglycine-generating enzyme required for sulfatase activity